MEKKVKISNELIYKILSNETSEVENKVFQKWLGQSPKNKKLFLRIEQLWLNSDKVIDYHKIDDDQAWSKISNKIQSKPVQNIFRSIAKIAAVVAIAYLLGVLTMYFVQSEATVNVAVESEISVKAPLGSKTEVMLSDGTKLWLNSGSEIRYPAIFDERKREVHLVGEAYFDVEKDENAPFFVHTNHIDIKVLGTRFNVKSYPEEGLVETTLEEGLVNISKKGSEQVLQLKPQQKATFVKSAGDIIVSDYSLQNLETLKGKRKEQFVIAENVDTEVYTSWKSDKLIFKREKFAVLTVKMERWYNLNITVENNKLKDERVTGIFENETVEQALEALRISVPFTYEINKNNVIIR